MAATSGRQRQDLVSPPTGDISSSDPDNDNLVFWCPVFGGFPVLTDDSALFWDSCVLRSGILDILEINKTRNQLYPGQRAPSLR